tara:strand:- start:29432 stop:29824 length:393 start_codon:yes stop_codon:yes gene_type:complete
MTWTCPGNEIVTTPPKPQIAIDVLFNAGIPPNITVGDPGAQVDVTGVQGIGVSTPIAAAVAAATAGLAILTHIPKGITSAKGVAEFILPAGISLLVVSERGRTSKTLGAIPKLHAQSAVDTVNCDILPCH